MHAGVIGPSVSIGSGLALLALAGFVASVRPRLPANTAFALFAFGFGGLWVAVGARSMLHLGQVEAAWLQFPFTLLWTAALAAMMFLFPVPITPAERRHAAVAVVFGGVILASGFLIPFLVDDSPFSVLPIVISLAVLFAFLLLVTLRFRTTLDAPLRRQYAIVAAAMALFVAFVAGSGAHPEGLDSVIHGQSWLLVWAVVRVAGVFLIAGLWLWMSNGRDGRMARNVALLILAVFLVGLLEAAYRPGLSLPAVGRFLMVALFAYAILRHQLLGVDVRVRWGVSKGVVAGIFLAVFFAVTELTKWFIENRFSGPGVDPALLGIAAAAMLLFAIAPLHRMADRVAARAIPVAPAPAVPVERREESYRRMLRRFLADEVITRDEERALAELAADLGIDAGRAFALREEVEDAVRNAAKHGSGAPEKGR